MGWGSVDGVGKDLLDCSLCRYRREKSVGSGDLGGGVWSRVARVVIASADHGLRGGRWVAWGRFQLYGIAKATKKDRD